MKRRPPPYAPKLGKVAWAHCLALGTGLLVCACSSEPEVLEPAPQDAGAAKDAKVDDQHTDGNDALDAAADHVNDASGDADSGPSDVSTDTTGDTLPDDDAKPPDAADAMGDGATDDAQDAPDGTTDAATDAGLGWALPICYFGDFDLDGDEQVACLRFPTLDREVLAATDLAVGTEVTAVATSPNGQVVALAGRAASGDPVSLQVYSLVDGTVKTIATAPDEARTIHRISFSRDGLRLAVMADFAKAGTTSLYVIPATGGTLKRVSPAAQAGLDVIDMAWAHGSTSPSVLAFVGDVHKDGIQELMTVDASITAPPVVPVLSEAQLAPNGDVQSGVQWDAQGQLVFRTNFESASAWQLYRAGVGGVGLDVIAGTVLHNGGGQATISSFALASDGERIAWSTNAPSAKVFEVYVMSLAAGSPPAMRVSSLPVVPPSTGVVGPTLPGAITWSPLGDSIAVLSDWPLGATDRDDNFSVFVLPSESPAGGVRVLGSAVEVDRNAREVQFLSNGAAVVVRGDLIANGVFELYVSGDVSTANQDLAAARVEEVPLQGDVLGIAER